MRADEFFDACLNRKLPATVINGAHDLAEVKLSVLPQLLDTTRYRMIGDFVHSGIFIETDKLAGNNYASLGFSKKENDKFYFPKTVLKEDIRKRVDQPNRIVAILSKEISDDPYTVVNYISNEISRERIGKLILIAL